MQSERIFKKGSYIFIEGDEESGSVFLVKKREMLLAVFGEGDIFGELALLTSSPGSATALSFGGVKVTPVDMDLFRDLITESPDLIRRIITSISQRL